MKAPTLFTDDGDTETELPWKWAICDCCDGHGGTSRHVECDGGGFTSSEWAEQDEDFREDYLAGRYDRPCDECSGSGKIQIADYDRMSPEDIKAYEQQLSDDADYHAMCAAERRMGA